MTDEAKALAERLRYTEEHGIFTAHDNGMQAMPGEAADLIEAQACEIERLREACDKADRLADHWFAQYETLRDGLVDILARAALGDSHDQ